MDKPCLKFTLLGKFQYAFGDDNYKVLIPQEMLSAILAYMAFHGSKSTYSGIRSNCWNGQERTTSAINKQITKVKAWFDEHGVTWDDYIQEDQGATFCFKSGMYETSDLTAFRKYYGEAESKQGENRYLLMKKALDCYTGPLLENVKGGWIRKDREKIELQRDNAETYVTNYVKEQGLTVPTASDFIPSQNAAAILGLATGIQKPEAVKHTRNARRLGFKRLPLYVAIVVIVVAVLAATWNNHNVSKRGIAQPTAAVVTDGADRQIALDATAWKMGNDPLPLGISQPAEYSHVHSFELKETIVLPRDFTKLHIRVRCQEQDRIIAADLIDPKGSAEDKTNYHIRREWEWRPDQKRHTLHGKEAVDVEVWLGVKQNSPFPSPPEGAYWFNPAVKKD